MKRNRLKMSLKYPLVVTVEMLSKILFSLPRYRFCNALKSFYLRILGAKIGANVVYYPGVWILPGRNLHIGSNVDIALDVVITTSGGVFIGDRVLIGYRSQILSSNHVIPNSRNRIFDAGHRHKKVRIDNDVWIGANCIILPGIHIGEGAVIAAGSVVTKSVEPFTVVGGNPLRLIRERKNGLRTSDETSTAVS